MTIEQEVVIIWFRINKNGKNRMSVTTVNEYTKVPMPKVNILRIRKLLENNYKVDHVINTDNKSKEEILEEIYQLLK